MQVDINLSGRLEIDEDDLKRLKCEGPQELLRALLIHDTKISTRVAEVYQKERK